MIRPKRFFNFILRQKKTILCFTALIIICLIYLLNFKIILVDGESMVPTLRSQQIVFLYRHPSRLQKDDLFVFHQENRALVKRVLAVSGDTIELKDKQVWRNGIALSPYTYEGEDKQFKLMAGEVFAIGDNYQNSHDSRNFGPVQGQNIIGKVIIH